MLETELKNLNKNVERLAIALEASNELRGSPATTDAVQPEDDAPTRTDTDLDYVSKDTKAQQAKNKKAVSDDTPKNDTDKELTPKQQAAADKKAKAEAQKKATADRKKEIAAKKAAEKAEREKAEAEEAEEADDDDDAVSYADMPMKEFKEAIGEIVSGIPNSLVIAKAYIVDQGYEASNEIPPEARDGFMIGLTDHVANI